MPACEGIETLECERYHCLLITAKRMPACEGIETCAFFSCGLHGKFRQEDARL